MGAIGRARHAGGGDDRELHAASLSKSVRVALSAQISLSVHSFQINSDFFKALFSQLASSRLGVRRTRSQQRNRDRGLPLLGGSGEDIGRKLVLKSKTNHATTYGIQNI